MSLRARDRLLQGRAVIQLRPARGHPPAHSPLPVVSPALPWDGPDFPVVTQMVRHKDKWVSPALAAFMDLARQTLALRESI